MRLVAHPTQRTGDSPGKCSQVIPGADYSTWDKYKKKAKQ